MASTTEILHYSQLRYSLNYIIETSNRLECLDAVKSFLLQYTPIEKCEILCQNINTNSSLFLALKMKYLDVVEYLFKDVPVNIRADYIGPRIPGIGNHLSKIFLTPLFYACMQGDLNVVKFLLEKGADISYISRVDDTELLPVHAAIRIGHLDITKYLLERMGKINVKQSSTFLAFIPDEQMLKYLLSKGFDTNMKDDKGMTSLHRSLSWDCSYKTVMLLLQAGADLNIKNDDGFDAIIIAAKENNETCFHLLSSQVGANEMSVINGLELLGAVRIVPVRIDQCKAESYYIFWQKALFMRYANLGNPILKSAAKPKKIFEFSTEFQTLDELEALKNQDQEQLLFNQAALILERVIGLTHPFTLAALSRNVPLVCGNYEQSFNILMFARNIYFEKDILEYECIWILRQILYVIRRGADSMVFFEQKAQELLKIIYDQMKILQNERKEIYYEIFGSDSDLEDEDEEEMQNKESGEKTGCDENALYNHILNEMSGEGKPGATLDSEKVETTGQGSNKDSLIDEKQHKLSSIVDGNRKPSGEEKCPADKNLRHDTCLIRVMKDESQRILNTRKSKYSTVPSKELHKIIAQCDKDAVTLFDCSLYLFYYILSIGDFKFKDATDQLFHQYIVEDARGSNGESMLHSVVKVLSEHEVKGNVTFGLMSDELMYDVSYRVASALFKHLLNCGANIDSFAHFGNTPLHYAVKPLKELEKFKDVKPNTTVKTLLSHGAHLDYYNAQGDCPLDILREMDSEVNEVRDITLQCLAAKVLTKHDICYEDYLPTYLREFVDKHQM